MNNETDWLYRIKGRYFLLTGILLFLGSSIMMDMTDKTWGFTGCSLLLLGAISFTYGLYKENEDNWQANRAYTSMRISTKTYPEELPTEDDND